MEFNIVPRHQKGLKVPVSYYMHNCEDKADIFIAGYLCRYCEADQTSTFLPHQIEHEITEILCTSIRFDDGERKFTNEGFDELSKEWHSKGESHICGDSLRILWSG